MSQITAAGVQRTEPLGLLTAYITTYQLFQPDLSGIRMPSFVTAQTSISVILPAEMNIVLSFYIVQMKINRRNAKVTNNWDNTTFYLQTFPFQIPKYQVCKWILKPGLQR